MSRFLRRRLSVQRLFPLTWRATSPYFEAVREGRVQPSRIGSLPMLLWTQVVLALEIIVLPLRLPWLLLVPPRHDPARRAGGGAG